MHGMCTRAHVHTHTHKHTHTMYIMSCNLLCVLLPLLLEFVFTSNKRDGIWQVQYRGADKSLARHISRCILFDCENISFDASLVIYINSTNIPPIMTINWIYETQNLLSL